MPDDLTLAVHQYLSTDPASLFAQQPVEMIDHWKGTDNLLWRVASRGTEAVLKLHLEAGQARGRRQFDAHTVFAPLGLAPAPLWYEHAPEGLPRPVSVYAWQEGHPVAAGSDLPDGLAHAVARIHATDPGGVQRFSPHPYSLDFYWRIEQASIATVQRWLAQAALQPTAAIYNQLSDAAAQVVEQALPLWATAPATPVHGDLQLEHALMTPRGICFVDWEMAGLGDPALEIARFLHHSRTLVGVESLAAWVDKYLSVMDSPGLEQRIAAYNSLLPFHATTYLLLGLHQHATPDPTFLDALPFLTDTLAAGLALSAASLSVELTETPAQIASQVATALTG